MTNQPSNPDVMMERMQALERKLDLLLHHVSRFADQLEQHGLLEKLEHGENYPLRNMPQPGNLHEDNPVPGLD
jgi:hypothetical protein